VSEEAAPWLVDVGETETGAEVDAGTEVDAGDEVDVFE